MPKPENFDSLRNNLADSVKLKYRISEEERKLPALFEELGKLAFERFNEGHATDPAVIEKCSEIKSIKDLVAEMEAELEAIRTGKTEEPAEEEPAAEEPPAPKPSEFDELGAVPVFGKPAPAAFCTNCGSKLLEGASFCLNCGKKIEAPAEPEPKPEAVSEPEPEAHAPQAETESVPAAESEPEPEIKPEEKAPAFCTKCGAKLIPGTMFCTKCGAKAWKPDTEAPAKKPGLFAGPKPDLGAIKPEIPEVKPDLSSLKPDLNAVKPEIPEVKPDLSSLKPDLGAIKSEIPDVKPDLSSLKPDLDAIKPEIPDVKPDLSSVSIPDVPTEIPLQEQLNDLADKVPANVLPDPGLKLPEEPAKPVARFCTQCGNKLVGDLPFCPICGHRR